MVLTDIEAQVAANEVGARRLIDFLDEYQLPDLTRLSQDDPGPVRSRYATGHQTVTRWRVY